MPGHYIIVRFTILFHPKYTTLIHSYQVSGSLLTIVFSRRSKSPDPLQPAFPNRTELGRTISLVRHQHRLFRALLLFFPMADEPAAKERS